MVMHVSAIRPKRVCFLDINRVMGSQGSYVWVCNCKNGLAPYRGEGRVTVPLAIGKADTAGREKATLRCIERNTKELTHTCRRNATHFQTRGLHVLRRCTKTKLNDSELKKTQPFTFSRSQCISNAGSSLAPKAEVLWFCKCVQPMNLIYNVVMHRISFFTEFSPTTPRREAVLIRECAREFESPIQILCRNSPGDFALAASQALETCCKRVRADSHAKFQCEDAVPDDVSSLKDE